MASDVDICNLALGNIGARAQVAAIQPPDGSAEAGLCARYYPLAKQFCLGGTHSFSVNRRQAQLAPVALPPGATWGYAYALPTSCIKPRRLLRPSQPTVGESPDSQGAPYTLQGKTLLCNEEAAVLVYSEDIEDVSLLDPDLVLAVAAQLTSHLAGPIIKGRDGARIGAQWAQAAAEYLSRAATADANSESQQNEHLTESMRAREFRPWWELIA